MEPGSFEPATWTWPDAYGVEMPDHLDLMFDCNDHRNGAFAGRVAQVAVYHGNEHVLTLEGVEKTFRELCDTEPDYPGFKIYGVGRATVTHKRDWVGNWCWNSYRVPFARAAMMLSRLSRLYGWRPTVGWSAVFDLYAEPDDKPAVTADDLWAAMRADR